MSDIVVELKRRNWTDAKIARELGMDQDEILRLAQVSGLAEMFSSRQFSNAWESDDDDMESVLGVGVEADILDGQKGYDEAEAEQGAASQPDFVSSLFGTDAE
jgi:DNA-directed RNA polymerase specialized sigma subunit